MEKSMLRKLIEKLQSLGTLKSAFDPSRFGDPIAMQTQWTPAKGGGTNFRTHKLVEVEINRLEFRASTGAKAFFAIFILMGLGAMIAFPLAGSGTAETSFDDGMLMPMAIGFVFVLAGCGMLYFGSAPIVFDKFRNAFWKGRKGPDDVADRRQLKYCVDLGNIHAIQLISEYCHSNKSSYYSYELNLVLKDGNRINVIDHGNLKRLREDAQTLSRFLGKPVWDAIG
jgi:hypothetical protein